MEGDIEERTRLTELSTAPVTKVGLPDLSMDKFGPTA